MSEPVELSIPPPILEALLATADAVLARRKPQRRHVVAFPRPLLLPAPVPPLAALRPRESLAAARTE